MSGSMLMQTDFDPRTPGWNPNRFWAYMFNPQNPQYEEFRQWRAFHARGDIRCDLCVVFRLRCDPIGGCTNCMARPERCTVNTYTIFPYPAPRMAPTPPMQPQPQPYAQPQPFVQPQPQPFAPPQPQPFGVYGYPGYPPVPGYPAGPPSGSDVPGFGPFTGSPSYVGPPVVGPPVVGPQVVGPQVVGPSVAGPPVVGPSVVGPSAVGPSVPGPAPGGTPDWLAAFEGTDDVGATPGSPSDFLPTGDSPPDSGSAVAGPSDKGKGVAGPSDKGKGKAVTRSIRGANLSDPQVAAPSVVALRGDDRCNACRKYNQETCDAQIVAEPFYGCTFCRRIDVPCIDGLNVLADRVDGTVNMMPRTVYPINRPEKAREVHGSTFRTHDLYEASLDRRSIRRCLLCEFRCAGNYRRDEVCDPGKENGMGCDQCSRWGVICVFQGKAYPPRQRRGRKAIMIACDQCKEHGRNCDRKRPCDSCVNNGDWANCAGSRVACFWRGIPGEDLPYYYTSKGYGPDGVDDPPRRGQPKDMPPNYHHVWLRSIGIEPTEENAPKLQGPVVLARRRPQRGRGNQNSPTRVTRGPRTVTAGPSGASQGANPGPASGPSPVPGPSSASGLSPAPGPSQASTPGAVPNTGTSPGPDTARPSVEAGGIVGEIGMDLGLGLNVDPNLGDFPLPEGYIPTWSPGPFAFGDDPPPADQPAATGPAPSPPGAGVGTVPYEEIRAKFDVLMASEMPVDEIRLHNSFSWEQLLAMDIVDQETEAPTIPDPMLLADYTEIWEMAKACANQNVNIGLATFRWLLRRDLSNQVEYANSPAAQVIRNFIQERLNAFNQTPLPVVPIVYPEGINMAIMETLNPSMEPIRNSTYRPRERPSSPGPINPQYRLYNPNIPIYDSASLGYNPDHPEFIHQDLLVRPIAPHPNAMPEPVLGTIPFNRILNDAQRTQGPTMACLAVPPNALGTHCGNYTSRVCEDTCHSDAGCPICDDCEARSRATFLDQIKGVLESLRAYACAQCAGSVAQDPGSYAGTGNRVYGFEQGAVECAAPNPRLGAATWGGFVGAPLPMSGCGCATKLLGRRVCSPHRLQHLLNLKQAADRMHAWVKGVYGRKVCFFCRERAGADAYGDNAGPVFGDAPPPVPKVFACMGCHEIVVAQNEIPGPEAFGLMPQPPPVDLGSMDPALLTFQ
ncbi:hypothetical protein F5B20DRAFT_595593 [Whalleya microplaca]|nr:hypothetical protein F5B20DRAFT_595593 [Whalleya microplaca]